METTFLKSINVRRANKLAVLTGGNGYIGRNLNRHLLNTGWDTVLLLRADSQPIYPFDKGFGYCRSLQYDGTRQSLDSLDLDDDAEVVFFHLAAHSVLSDALNNLDRLLDSNIRFGTHLLDYMSKNGFRNLVLAESYWQFDQEGSLGGNNLYSASKSALSLLAQHYSKNMQIVSLVLYDVYGPDDNRGKLVNLLIKSAVTQVPVDITQGEQLLDYVYIDDVVRAFDIAGTSLLKPSCHVQQGFCRATVRTMDARKLREYVDIIGQVVGRTPNVRWGAKPYPAHQIMTPWLPPASAQLPGWLPTFSFPSGVQKIVV